MPLEERHPRLVAEDVGAIRGAHDVAEHDRGEDAIVLRRRPDAGQELLDLVDDRIGVPGVGQVVDARELHELAPGMCAARYRAWPGSRKASSRRWRTSVGTWIAGRIGRTSIWVFITKYLTASPGPEVSR
jgi:hypothetical protein